MHMLISLRPLCVAPGTSGTYSSISSSPDLGISTGDMSQGEGMDVRTGGDGCPAAEGAATSACVWEVYVGEM